MAKIIYTLIISLLFISCQESVSQEDKELKETKAFIQAQREQTTKDSMEIQRELKMREAEIISGKSREDVKNISFD